MRGKFGSGAAAIFIGTLFVAGEVGAQFQFVSEAPLTSCSTGNQTLIEAVGSSVPVLTSPCPNVGGTCFLYEYRITRAPSNPIKVDYVEFSVSATQEVVALQGPPASFIYPALGGENDFLEGARHEYTVRFSLPPNTYDVASLKIFVKPFAGEKSVARIGTVQVKGGNRRESCVIATPGVTSGDLFQPVFQSQAAVVAGGKCPVILSFDASGNVSDVQLASGAPSTCIRYSGDVTVTIGKNTGLLQNNTSPYGLTFGSGTTTCYGPPRPSIPKCICSAEPCP